MPHWDPELNFLYVCLIIYAPKIGIWIKDRPIQNIVTAEFTRPLKVAYL